MLWPDQEVEVGRRNLRQALSSLRQALGDSEAPMLQTYHDSVGLEPDLISTDAGDFERFANAAMSEQAPQAKSELSLKAVQLYRGELLPGFAEDWILGERLRLEDLFLSMLRQVVKGVPAEHWGEAAGFLRLGVAKEPLNEDWHLALAEIYLGAGQVERALLQIEQLKGILDRELGVKPSEKTRRLEIKAQKAKADRAVSKPVTVSLPAVFTKTFGREMQIEAIVSAIDRGGRLVTITGAAGIGKTRTGLQVGYRFRDRGTWSVYFVSASECDDAPCLIDAICSSLFPTGGTPANPVLEIAQFLEKRETLLILDNLEQMVEDAALVTAQLLASAPDLRLLITTRQRLEIEGEVVFGLHPLAVPVIGDSSDMVRNSPSVRLFLDRCEAGGQSISESQLSSVVGLCEDLEGVPLALEIAAGLCGTFSPEQVRQHLPVRLSSVARERRGSNLRHRSLEDAIGYSVQALPIKLQKLFAQLAIFRGDFSVEAAFAICQGCDSLSDCFESILALQKRSLLESSNREKGAPRFKLLNPFREFAIASLGAEEVEALRERHSAYFEGRAPEENQNLTMATQALQHGWIDDDYANIIAAAEHCFQRGVLAGSVVLLGAVSLRWFTRGPRSVERDLIRKVANADGFGEIAPILQIRLLRMLGTTHIRASEYLRAYEACSRAVEIAIATGDRELIAVSLSGLSICTGYLGRMEETLELNLRVLEFASEKSFRLKERSYLGLGSVNMNMGKLAEAEKALLEAKRCSEEAPDGEPDALILVNLARLALDLGHFEECLKLCSQAMRRSELRSDELGMAIAMSVMTRFHWLKGDLTSALKVNSEALKRCLEGDFSFWILHAVRSCGLLIAECGYFSESATLLAATSDIDGKGRMTDDEDLSRCVYKLKSAMGEASFDTSWCFGLAMSRDEASRLALDMSAQLMLSDAFVSC
jgi:predicted ATPase/DNA-binding SARP family transcriptional activator